VARVLFGVVGFLSLVGVGIGAGSAAVAGVVVGGAGSAPAGAAGTPPPGAGGGSTGGTGGEGGPAVPATWEVLDAGAAATCPGLPWSVLAAIGRVETDSGRSDAPGVHSGTNAAGAEGPMQFEPATFAEYATVGPGGVDPASPYDPVDAVYTAARLLCADGAGHPEDLAGAVYSYNHSTTYVDEVTVLAAALADDPPLGAEPATALAFAAAQFGVPYLWGGTGAGGYDCSGLVQAAYEAAGVGLPRTAQDQYVAGPAAATGAPPEPGDLVFFGTSTTTVEHVGIYVAGGEMIDAPYTGTVVRLDPVTAPAPALQLVGVTRPAA
jgi:cell wall-associated NlpC family hydrolase